MGPWPGSTGVLCWPLSTAVPGEEACWAYARWKTAGSACTYLSEAGLREFILTASQCHAGYGRSWAVDEFLLAFGHQECFCRGPEMIFLILGGRMSCCPAGRAALCHWGGDIQSSVFLNVAGEGVAKNWEWGSFAHPTTEISSSSINWNSCCCSSLH